MKMTLRVMSRLLCYPDAELKAALPEMATVLVQEDALPADARLRLAGLLEQLDERPLTQLQEEYVSLFDRGRHLSLHLFEHVHGESRERGQAMVDLMDHYQSRGFELAARELPDYIPLFLEFLSTQDTDDVVQLLGDAMPVMVLLGARLEEKGAAYAALFGAIEALGGSCADAEEMRRQAAAEGPDETIEKMDEIWEEEQVTFLANAAPDAEGCSLATDTKSRPLKWIDHSGRAAAGRR
jgi:nitrate reductase molybdenum cofactor assembly chaperone NarJ/NarW